MLIVGLTGGIGAGKSTVTQLFASHGVPIIDADIIAREVTQPSQPAYKEIIQHFGEHLILKDGSLDRSLLRHLIFENRDERKWLEALLHPIIQQSIEQQISSISAPYCIVVIPLLFEVQPYSFINRILVIDAPEQMQIDRVLTRDQLNTSQIEAILKAQVSREQRIQGSDDLILNNGDLDDLSKQVEKLHQFYLKLGVQ